MKKCIIIVTGFIFMTYQLQALSPYDKKFWVIGHRGACGYEPENTLISFEKALALGVDVVECDVFKCKSGEIVVIHDFLLEEKTNGNGYVHEKTLPELQQLKVGKNAIIPTLQQVLNTVDKKAIVNIEIKAEAIESNIANLIDEYVNNHGWSYDHFLVSSFNHHILMEFSKLCPHVKIGALTSSVPLGLAKFAHEMGVYFIGACGSSINQAFVDDAHARGLKVFVFTINSASEIERIKRLGVDGIFSDFPDRLL